MPIDPAVREEWRRAWPLPFVSAIGYGVAVAHIYSAGLFIAPLEQEFGWSRAAITAGLTVISVISVVLAPAMGGLIDRVGARRIGIPGMVFYTAALAALSLTGSSLWMWWSLWVVLAFATLMVKATVWTTAVASRFDRSRGLAMAITLCGAGVGSAVLPILTSRLLTEFGWRGAYVALGLILAVVSIPLLLPFFRDAKDERRRRPDPAAAQHVASGLSFRAAIRSSQFVKLALVSYLSVTAITGLLVHFVPILTSKGFDRTTAAGIAGLVGIGSMVGRIGTGYLLDRINGSLVGAIGFSLPIVVLVALGEAAAMPWVAAPAAFLFGLTLGCEVDVLGYLASRHFGMRAFGALFGSMVGLQSLAVGTGPLLAGYIYDTTGGYQAALIGFVPVFIASSMLISTLGRYPRFDAEAGEDTSTR